MTIVLNESAGRTARKVSRPIVMWSGMASVMSFWTTTTSRPSGFWNASRFS